MLCGDRSKAARKVSSLLTRRSIASSNALRESGGNRSIRLSRRALSWCAAVSEADGCRGPRGAGYGVVAAYGTVGAYDVFGAYDVSAPSAVGAAVDC